MPSTATAASGARRRSANSAAIVSVLISARVAHQHQHVAGEVAERLERRLDGVAGAERRRLDHGLRGRRGGRHRGHVLADHHQRALAAGAAPPRRARGAASAGARSRAAPWAAPISCACRRPPRARWPRARVMARSERWGEARFAHPKGVRWREAPETGIRRRPTPSQIM